MNYMGYTITLKRTMTGSYSATAQAPDGTTYFFTARNKGDAELQAKGAVRRLVAAEKKAKRLQGAPPAPLCSCIEYKGDNPECAQHGWRE